MFLNGINSGSFVEDFTIPYPRLKKANLSQLNIANFTIMSQHLQFLEANECFLKTLKFVGKGMKHLSLNIASFPDIDQIFGQEMPKLEYLSVSNHFVSLPNYPILSSENLVEVNFLNTKFHSESNIQKWNTPALEKI